MRAKTEMAFGRIPAHCKYELYMERYRSAAEIIRSEIALDHTVRFLDVGCGEGNMKYFFDAHEGQWHGIECWKEREEMCRGLGYEVAAVDINTTALPHPDAHFDVVIASHVIEHLSAIAFALGEMDRVLKPGGLLVVATPTKPPGIAQLLQFVRSRQAHALGETQHAFSALSLRRFLGRTLPGYELIDSRGLRIVSSRKRLKLENSYAFYRVNTFLAKYLTGIAPEVNLVYRKAG